MSNDEKPTVEIAAVPDWAVKLTEKVVGGFTAVNVRLDGLEGTDKTLANEVARMSTAVDDLRAADRRHEDDVRRLSDRIKAPSSADLSNESLIASEIVARTELAAKVDALTATQEVQLAILSRLDKVASNPTVKVIAGMIATALLTWLASHGGSLK